ncbi:MAG: hypothetical protein IAE87_03585 [Rhodobacteraceae bacterium]|jgi:hypothetical protein|nr:hypothetical protein [Paracoccaceae bacterium]
MHVVSLLRTEMFSIRLGGATAALAELFPGWSELDRFGLVIDEPLGGVGASHLLQCAMMAYYDVKPARRTSRAVYPEIYAFHIGKSHGAHAPYDFWPARREVILRTDDHREILDAINDRGITRLAIPDRPPRDVVHRPKEVEAALDRIASAFVYSASGRLAGGDVEIAGTDKRTEFNANQVLRPVSDILALRRAPGAVSSSGIPIKEADDDYARWLETCDTELLPGDRQNALEVRQALRSPEGLVTETCRRVEVGEALQRLASAGLSRPSAAAG